MFTGIVEEIGHVAAIEVRDEQARLEVACRTVVADAALGDSVAVAGCCLTVAELTADGFAADLMAETLRATSLGDLEPGDPVNLERALQAGARLGGHLVQGHVDGVGTVTDREQRPGTVFLTIRAPASMSRYVVPKGSLTVDGTSLTVVDRRPADGDGDVLVRVGLIPHTLAVTTFGSRSAGDRVNLEADVIAKYVERLLAADAPTPYRP